MLFVCKGQGRMVCLSSFCRVEGGCRAQSIQYSWFLAEGVKLAMQNMFYDCSSGDGSIDIDQHIFFRVIAFVFSFQKSWVFSSDFADCLIETTLYISHFRLEALWWLLNEPKWSPSCKKLKWSIIFNVI